jgi:hypothetical protein
MDVDKLMVPDGTADLYTDQLRYTLESFIPYLQAHPDTQTLEIDPADGVRYAGDLAGLLYRLKKIGPDLHWIIARVNGLDCCADYTEDMLTLLIPSSTTINQIRQADNTTNRISA